MIPLFFTPSILYGSKSSGRVLVRRPKPIDDDLVLAIL